MSERFRKLTFDTHFLFSHCPDLHSLGSKQTSPSFFEICWRILEAGAQKSPLAWHVSCKPAFSVATNFPGGHLVPF